jgi:hypothetical protein
MSPGDRCRAKRTNDGPRAVITGSPWSYWQVYVGFSLALLLVTGGLTLAIQNCTRTPTSQDVADNSENDIPAQHSLIQERKENLPTAEAKGSLANDLPIEVALAKSVPALPLKAKMNRASETPAPEPQPVAKTEPAKQPIQIVETKPAPDTPAPKVPVAEDKRDPTCGTAIHFVHSPTVANRDALKEDKLVFILHVSGNFEDPQFT